MSMNMIEALSEAFRPNTSAICDQKGINAADVKLKADTIQFNWEVSRKSLAIHGKALAILQLN